MELVIGSGHEWDRCGERCTLCGDKDWRADKFCAGNPAVAEQRRTYMDSLVEQECCAANAGVCHERSEPQSLRRLAIRRIHHD